MRKLAGGTAVVALDMTRVINPDLEIIAAKNQAAAVDTVQKFLTDFMRHVEQDAMRYQRDFKKGARIDAVLIRGTVVSFSDDARWMLPQQRNCDLKDRVAHKPMSGARGSTHFSRCPIYTQIDRREILGDAEWAAHRRRKFEVP